MVTLARRRPTLPCILVLLLVGAGCAVGETGEPDSGRDARTDVRLDGRSLDGSGNESGTDAANRDAADARSCSTTADCDDHLACNGIETCGTDSLCHAGRAVNCADTFNCTDDVCAEPSGSCNHLPHDDRCTNGNVCDPMAGCVPPPPCRTDPDCDDGNNCNGRERCDMAFGCRSGMPLECDDHLGCTIDSCDPAAASGGDPDAGTGDASGDARGSDGGAARGACTHIATDVRCSDGNLCNGLEACVPASMLADMNGCVAGAPLNCLDAIDCTADTCNPATGCAHTPDNSLCDDHDVCNGVETCIRTLGCAPGVPLACADTIGCTVDSCNAMTGCAHTPRDSLCSDGNGCNGIERCDSSGATPGTGCRPRPAPDCDDTISCTVDTCVASGSDMFVCRHSGDADGDGHNVTGCAGGDDCNDADPMIHGGRADICANGIDDNCDGNRDEGCGGCTPGTTGTCYDGPPATSGVGPCHGGMRTCLASDAWGTCGGQVIPVAEVCANSLDDDCNGIIDNGCGECIPATTEGCYNGPAGTNGIGTCRGGTRACTMADLWGPCIGEQGPATEICANGLDDDCDGTVDNGCGVCTPGMTGSCYDGPMGTNNVGPCHTGAHTCGITDYWGACIGQVVPVSEICANGIDDDCNGVVDNGCGECTPGTTGPCYGGPVGTQNIGTCRGGSHTCQMNDFWGACTGQVVPRAEVCANGSDDDCNGIVDNGCGECTPGTMGTCYSGAAGTSGMGNCHGGNHTCGSNDMWGPCSGEVVPVTEVCANAIDDDCNGIVDNGCGVCTPGATGTCYSGPSGSSGVGACHGGNHTCTSADIWGACLGEVVPVVEVCANGVDDDCNGTVDNGCGVCTPGSTGSCYDGPAGSSGVGTCRGGTHTCTVLDEWGTCTGQIVPRTEICANGLDDDCNGIPDNGCPGCIPRTSTSCYTGAAGTNGIGVCHGGSQTCQDDDTYGACIGEVSPSSEICGNSLDDDCNGVVDNGCGVCTPGATQSCYSGATGTNGVGLCRGGTATCQADSAWGPCTGEVVPRPETCADGTDEDCNAIPDNGCPGCTPRTTQSCYTGPSGSNGTGICHGGIQTCTSADTWGSCNGEQTPIGEVCANSADDDCNGIVDNGCGVCTPGATGPCYDGPAGTSGVGVCRGGTRTCQTNDLWGACTGQRLPGPEICANGLDEDCNTVPDNGCPGCIPGTSQMCYTGPAGTSGVGTCHGGTQTCNSMDVFGPCNGQQAPIAEVCANSADDDCNGTVDNGCGVCTPGSTGACYTGPAGTNGVGACIGGTHTCQTNNTWGACSGQRVPVAEVCANSTDDDCNGVVDNGCGVCTPGSTGACYDGPPGTSGVGPCRSGTHVCQPSDTWGTCTGQQLPIGEVCGNGVDDNCNGVTDDACGPANDRCPAAIALSVAGTSTTVTGTTVGSAHDVTLSCGLTTSSPDVYYTFTLPSRQIVYFDTVGSTYDTVLGLLANCTTQATVTVGASCDDDMVACSGLQSQLVTVLNPGTYYLLVSGYNGASGPFTLHFQHLPAGGHNVAALPAGMASNVGSTVGGTNATSSNCALASAGAGPEDAWYFIRCASATASYTAATCSPGASWDTVIYMKSGLGAADVCNDDACGLQSSLAGSYSTPAGSGGLFVLYVDGYGTSSGSYTMTSNVP